MSWCHAFAFAWALLTRIPLPSAFFARQHTAIIETRAVVFYPLIGVALGLFCYFTALVLPSHLPDILKAALVLVVWVGVTGAIHLDGLADTIDAASAAHKDPQKIFEVLADPRIGTMAVVCLILVLLSKYVLIYTLIGHQQLLFFLLFTPAMSRLLGALYIVLTPYAKTHGLAANIQRKVLRLPVFALALASIALVSGIMGMYAFVIIVFLALFLWYWRHLWMKRINGFNGDCVGALIELAELGLLFLFALWRGAS